MSFFKLKVLLSQDILYISFSVVEFRTEELMKKAVEKVNKHNFNGRPLKVKEVGHGGGKQRDRNVSCGFSVIISCFLSGP